MDRTSRRPRALPEHIAARHICAVAAGGGLLRRQHHRDVASRHRCLGIARSPRPCCGNAPRRRDGPAPRQERGAGSFSWDSRYHPSRGRPEQFPATAARPLCTATFHDDRHPGRGCVMTDNIEQAKSESVKCAVFTNCGKAERQDTSVKPPKQRLMRVPFTVSRLMEFCTRRELVNQTGHDVLDWPMVVIKEAVDNALDAAEEAEIAPVVSIAVKGRSIIIKDNGPGYAHTTLGDWGSRVQISALRPTKPRQIEDFRNSPRRRSGYESRTKCRQSPKTRNIPEKVPDFVHPFVNRSLHVKPLLAGPCRDGKAARGAAPPTPSHLR